RKGLGVHSYSLLEYALEGEYSRFQATIGLDESACPTEVDATDSGAGCVVFRARLDDQLLLEKALTWKDAPVPIDLSVKGGKALVCVGSPELHSLGFMRAGSPPTGCPFG